MPKNELTAIAIIETAQRYFDLVHDADDIGYAITKDTVAKKCYRIKSPEFKEELVYRIYKDKKEVASEFTLSSTLPILVAEAKQGEEKTLHRRVACYGGSYWIDLCNEQGQAIKVNADGYSIVDDSPVLFVKSNTMYPLPTPIEGQGDFDKLWDAINIDENDRLIYITWLLECFRPETPYPLLEFSGEQGSAKSTTHKRTRLLVDPNKALLRKLPKSERDLFISSNSAHTLSFENVSHLSNDMQDTFCMIATGSGDATRKLYTDMDEIVNSYKNPIIINGIYPTITTQDLIDRTVHLDLPNLNKIKEETVLEDYWKAWYPAIFTGLLDLFVNVLAELASVELTDQKRTRMADFEKLGEAVYLVYGRPANSFLDFYHAKRKDNVARTIDESPVALAITTFLAKSENSGGFHGTIQELLTELTPYRPEYTERWVTSAKGLSQALQRLQPALRQIGIHFSRDPKRSESGYKCSLAYIPNADAA